MLPITITYKRNEFIISKNTLWYSILYQGWIPLSIHKKQMRINIQIKHKTSQASWSEPDRHLRWHRKNNLRQGHHPKSHIPRLRAKQTLPANNQRARRQIHSRLLRRRQVVPARLGQQLRPRFCSGLGQHRLLFPLRHREACLLQQLLLEPCLHWLSDGRHRNWQQRFVIRQLA